MKQIHKKHALIAIGILITVAVVFLIVFFACATQEARPDVFDDHVLAPESGSSRPLEEDKPPALDGAAFTDGKNLHNVAVDPVHTQPLDRPELPHDAGLSPLNNHTTDRKEDVRQGTFRENYKLIGHRLSVFVFAHAVFTLVLIGDRKPPHYVLAAVSMLGLLVSLVFLAWSFWEFMTSNLTRRHVRAHGHPSYYVVQGLFASVVAISFELSLKLTLKFELAKEGGMWMAGIVIGPFIALFCTPDTFERDTWWWCHVVIWHGLLATTLIASVWFYKKGHFVRQGKPLCCFYLLILGVFFLVNVLFSMYHVILGHVSPQRPHESADEPFRDSQQSVPGPFLDA